MYTFHSNTNSFWPVGGVDDSDHVSSQDHTQSAQPQWWWCVVERECLASMFTVCMKIPAVVLGVYFPPTTGNELSVRRVTL